MTLVAVLLAPGQLNARISLLGIKSALVQFALERINVPGSLEITVERLEKVEDDATDLVGLTVADRDGVWLRIDRVSMGWIPRRLVRGELAITRLAATNVQVLRQPVFGGDAAPVATPADGPVKIAWPRAPLTVAADGLALNGVTIAAGVVGEQAVTFNAEGRLRDEGDEQSATFSLTRTDAIAGQIRLNYLRDFAADTLRLKLDADEAPGGLVATLAGLPPGAAAEVHLNGDGPILEWAGDLRAAIGDVGDLEGRIAVPSVQPAHVRLDVRARALGLLKETAAPLLDEPVDLKTDLVAAEDGLVTLNNLDVNGSLGSLLASGTFDANSGRMDLRVDADLPAVGEPLLPGAKLSGFRFNGRVEGVPDNLRARGQLNAAALVSPAVDAGGVLVQADVRMASGEVRFSVDGSAEALRADRLNLTANGPVTLDIAGLVADEKVVLTRADIASPLLNAGVQGEMRLDGSTLALAYKASANDLAPIAVAYETEAGGGLLAEGQVAGSLASPVITGNASLTGFSYNGEPVGDARLVHEVRIAETVSGTASFTAETEPFGQAAAQTAFTLQGEKLTISTLEASALNVKVRGETPVAIDLASGMAEGRVSWNSPNLREVGRVAGSALTGAGRGTLVLRRQDTRQDADITASLTRFGAEGIVIETVTARAGIRDVLAAEPAITASVEAKAAAIGGVPLDTASVAAKGTLASLNMAASLDGTAPDGRDITAEMTVRASLAGPRQTIRISRLIGQYAGEEVSLREPLTIAMEQGTVRANGIVLDIPGGQVDGGITLAGNRLRGKLAIDLPDISRLAVMTGLSIQGGALQATTSFDSQRSATLQAEIKALRSEHLPREAAGLDITLSGEWDGRTASADARVDGGFGAPALVAASVALRPSAGIIPLPKSNAALRGSVKWEGRVESVWAALPAPDHYLEGAADLDLAVTGTLSNPVLAGSIALSDGRYENLETGTILADLSAVSEIAPDGAFVVDVVGNDGANAPVTARLSVKDGMVDGNVETRKAMLVRRPELEAVMTADIAVNGPMAGPAISGEILVNRAEVRLINALPPDIATLGDVRIKGAPKPREKPSKDSPIGLDLRIYAPDSLFVRGRGLDSEWRMDITVDGNSGRPNVRGSIEKVRGQLVLVGRTFALDTGRIAFSGATPVDPDLDVRLTRENDGIRGGVVVSGRASDPQINFVSTPSLPKGEVMPRLLFGESRQSLTAFQAVELASGIATLLDGSGGRIDQIRSAVGLDVLRFQDDGDGAGVTVGKNVSEGVFVGATQPLDGSAPRVRVEIEVYDNFAVETDVGTQGGTSVGVKWKRDF
jgi:translocation and assembly module TamB